MSKLRERSCLARPLLEAMQDLKDLERQYERQARELDELVRQIERDRRPLRWLLLLASFIAGAIVVWLIVALLQMVIAASTLECVRMSTIDCRQVGASDGAYWFSLATRLLMLVLLASVLVYALLMLRAFSKPAPGVIEMQTRLQHLKAKIAQARDGAARRA